MKKLTVIYFFLVLHITAFTQQTIIQGNNKTYAGQILKLYALTDRITFTPTLLDSCRVDTAGNFKFHLANQQIQQVFINLDSKRGFLYAVPGKKYTVSLPHYQPLKLEQILNPYFQPEYFRLPLQNMDTNDINLKIYRFDLLYDITIKRLVIRNITNKDSVEHAISLLKKYTPEDTNKFYQNYISYRYATIRVSTYYKDLWHAARKYFLFQEPQLDNPAYMTLFNQIFDNCFSPLKHFFPTRKILANLRTGSFNAMLDSFITLDTNINPLAAQLVILRGLHDLYYDQDYLQESIIRTINNATAVIKDTSLLLIANNILKKITALRPGYPAPGFKLPGRAGIRKSLKNFRGKFVYLNFCHPQSLGCQEQMPLLQRYMQQAPSDFTVVTILYGVDKKQFHQFLKKHKDYNWPVLWGGAEPSLLKKYNIVAFPTYYLISPEGKLLKSPAPPPTENFEQIFSSEYKKWHRQHQNAPSIRTP